MPITLAVIDIARPTPIRQEFILDGHKIYMRVRGQYMPGCPGVETVPSARKALRARGQDMPMFPGVETVLGARKAFADFFPAYAQSTVNAYRHEATVTITYPRQPQI